MSEYITIHQFSTGIEVQNLGEGQWISRGFKSGYMNSTLPSIPYAVERAIKNQEFDARCADNSRPAIVGRVVRHENDYWSVVTIVTVGKDESRSFPVYRYFLCEGKDNLCIILAWLLEQLEQQSLPVFNPFQQPQELRINHQTVQQYRDQAKNLDTQLENYLNNDPQMRDYYSQYPPIILGEGQYKYENIQIIDRLAYKIAQNYNSPISWSYNVKVLEKPETFLIIQPAPEAYSSFQSVKRSPLAAVTTSNETEIKSAIQSLAELKDIRSNLRIIENTIAEIKSHDVETLNPYLKEIFESWGTSKVVDEKIYTANFIEIAALRAILLPETLINYLSYSEIEKIKTSGNKRNDVRERSLIFLNELRKEIQKNNDLTHIKLKLRDGILILIEEFCQNPQLSFTEKLLYGNNIKIPLEILLWLINDTGSVWHLSKPEALISIKYNLGKIDEYYKKNNLSELNANKTHSIYNDLITYRKRQQAIPKYKPLSDLFFTLQDYELAYYFYVVANGRGKFDPKIVKYLPPDKKDVFGFSIPRPMISNASISHNHNQQDAKWVNLFLSLIIFIFLLISVAIKPFNLSTTLIVIIAGVLIFVYSTEEQIRSLINKYSLPIIILALLVGNFSNRSVNLDNLGITNNDIKPQTSNPPSPTNVSPATSNPQPSVNDNISAQVVNRAVSEFSNPGKTREAIDQIITNLTYTNGWKDDQVKSALKSVLGLDNNFNYSELSQESKPENVEIFVRAIIKYQKSKKLSTQNADGIIDVDSSNNPKRTMNILQDDVKNKLNNPS